MSDVETCIACGQRNRLPLLALSLGKSARCGKCKAALSGVVDTALDSQDDADDDDGDA